MNHFIERMNSEQGIKLSEQGMRQLNLPIKQPLALTIKNGKIHIKHRGIQDKN